MPSSFILEPFQEQELCPVLQIQYYLYVCQLLNVHLDDGYFFRATGRGRAVS